MSSRPCERGYGITDRESRRSCFPWGYSLLRPSDGTLDSQKIRCTMPAVKGLLSRVLCFGSGLALVLFVAGCGSTGGGAGDSGGGLSRKIEFAPRYNIEKAIMTVFQSDGFELLPGSGQRGRFLFLREGDTVGQERFGEWFGPGVTLRAEVSLVEVEFGTHRVYCVLQVSNGGAFVVSPGGERRGRILLQRVKKLADVL